MAIIAATPPTVVAFLAYRQAKNTHLAVNSRMTELLEITRKSSADEATLNEKAAQQQREAK